MSKFWIFSAAIAMAGGVSSVATAQCSCCMTQSYQRYSYQPSVVSPVQATQNSQTLVPNSQTLVPGQSSNAIAGNAVVQAPAGAVQPQSYQRYSYQPQPTYQPQPVYQAYQPQSVYQPSTTRSYAPVSRRNPWEYAKGERQRYLP